MTYSYHQHNLEVAPFWQSFYYFSDSFVFCIWDRKLEADLFGDLGMDLGMGLVGLR